MAQHRARQTTVKAGDAPTSGQLRAVREWLEQVRRTGHGAGGETEEERRRPAPSLEAALGVVLEREFPRYTPAEQGGVLAELSTVEPAAWAPALERLLHMPAIPYRTRLAIAARLNAAGIEPSPDVLEPLTHAQAIETHIRERLAKAGDTVADWHDVGQDLQTLPPPMAKALLHDVAETAPVLPLLHHLVEEGTPQLLPVVVDTLSTMTTPEAAALLATIAAKTPTKELQKAARRALYRLKTLGVDTDSLPSQEPRRSVLEVPKLPVVAALASHIDFEGNRALHVARRRPFSGLVLVSLVLNEQHGVIDCHVLPVTKKDLSSILAEIRADDRLTHVDLPPSYAQQLVEESYQRNLSTGTPLPRDFQAVHDLIGTPDTPWERPPIYDLVNPEEISSQPALLSQAAQLLDVKEFQGWSLPPEMLQKYREDAKRTAESPIIVSPALQQERVDAIQKRTMRELFDAEQCTRYRRRLEEMAYLLWHTNRHEEAKRALAAALALQEGRLDVAEHPFLRALFTRSLEMAEALEHEDQGRVTLATPRLWTP